MIKDCSDAARFARAHGISEEVWSGRPYRRWTPEDMTALDETFGAGFSLRGKVSKVSSEWIDGEEDGHNGSGWIIDRYAVDAADLPDVTPEMRPDNAVELRPARSHFHGEIEDFPFPILEVKPSSMVGGPKWIHYRCGEGESRWVPAYRPTSFAMVGTDEIPDGHINRSKDKGHDSHAGVNSSKIHSHVKKAKYLFKPSPKVDREWEHTHDEEHYIAKPDALAGHMAKRHNGEVVVDGPHLHSDRVKNPDCNYAARIDVHPMAAERLVATDVVFFGLEGCIKADALLTAIIREGCNASVISVPSVSLWDCPELALTVSRFLKGKTVVIVVDADGVDNPSVVNQAAMCQTMLVKLGVGEVLVAAPALDVDSKIIVDPVIGKLKGVDDFLAAGYKLSDLAVATSVAPSTDLLALVKGISPPRCDSQQRLFDLLFSFSTFAGESGQLRAPMVTVAKVLGVSRWTVGRVIQRLVDAEVVTVWADPALLCAGKLAARQDFRRRWDWEERPFLVLCKQYRATMVRQPLGYVA